MYLCQAFWKTPLTGTDSQGFLSPLAVLGIFSNYAFFPGQAGTLVHEWVHLVSHFSDAPFTNIHLTSFQV